MSDKKKCAVKFKFSSISKEFYFGQFIDSKYLIQSQIHCMFAMFKE